MGMAEPVPVPPVDMAMAEPGPIPPVEDDDKVGMLVICVLFRGTVDKTLFATVMEPVVLVAGALTLAQR